MNRKVFGKTPSGSRLARIMQSPNYKNGSFQNIEPTEITLKNASFYKMLKDFSGKPKTVKPSGILPFMKTAISPSAAPVITWFGHSSYHIQSNNYSILVDPVFSGNASPVSFFGKAFKGADQYSADDFSTIDLLIVTHDHYDHLDYLTITTLKDKIRQIITPLGVGAHLEYWGVDAARITELDWWQSKALEPDITITASPARHFSGRALVRNKTLWASFILVLHGYRIFIGGDSGYDAQFALIGSKHGPFDLAILECGQYGDDWPYIHMKPEETVQAALDLKAAMLMPVHWGKFVLAFHPWNDPVTRVIASAKKHRLPVVAPRIGASFTIGEGVGVDEWWNL